jgi:DNA-directed RNA polymerase subunit beta
VIVAEGDGKVASVTADQIIINHDGEIVEGKKKLKHDPESGVYIYELSKFMRSERRHLRQPEADRQAWPEDQEG